MVRPVYEAAVCRALRDTRPGLAAAAVPGPRPPDGEAARSAAENA
ncbi:MULTISPECIES: hypothetical protein [unclassified Streptomyces]|nr:hypothetical protein [Streptomyces sp. sk2.1]